MKFLYTHENHGKTIEKKKEMRGEGKIFFKFIDQLFPYTLYSYSISFTSQI